MDKVVVFRDNTIFLLQHVKQILTEKGLWDEEAERFRTAWGDPGFTLAERQQVFLDFFAEYRIELLSDGYSWLGNAAICIALPFVDVESGKKSIYGSIKIGSCFKIMQHEKAEARLADNAPGEKLATEKEMQLYRALLTIFVSVLGEETREYVLVGKILQDYTESTDGSDNPMLAKMMGSAGGIFDLIVSATEDNKEIPDSIKATLKNLQEKVGDGMTQGPEGLMDIMQGAFSGGEMTNMFAEMQNQAGGNPLFGNMIGLMTSDKSMEEKAAQITELSSDPAILDEIKRQMTG